MDVSQRGMERHLSAQAADWSESETQLRLMDLYQVMEQALGDLHWWPAETVDEVIIGAILVQNVAWRNALIAIERLKQSGLLTLRAISDVSVEDIEPLVKSTRFYRTKARKLKAFADHVAASHNADLGQMLDQPMIHLRQELLSIYGIGPETADDIVLYAANQPSFVIDAYTKRILTRIGWIASEDIPYEVLRHWLMQHLPPDVSLFNQFHALLDAVGHRFCTPVNPSCQNCPVQMLCQAGTRS